MNSSFLKILFVLIYLIIFNSKTYTSDINWRYYSLAPYSEIDKRFVNVNDQEKESIETLIKYFNRISYLLFYECCIHIPDNIVYYISDNELKKRDFYEWLPHGLESDKALIECNLGLLKGSKLILEKNRFIQRILKRFNEFILKFGLYQDLSSIDINIIKDPGDKGTENNPIEKAEIANIFFYRWAKEILNNEQKKESFRKAVKEVEEKLKHIQIILTSINKKYQIQIDELKKSILFFPKRPALANNHFENISIFIQYIKTVYLCFPSLSANTVYYYEGSKLTYIPSGVWLFHGPAECISNIQGKIDRYFLDKSINSEDYNKIKKNIQTLKNLYNFLIEFKNPNDDLDIDISLGTESNPVEKAKVTIVFQSRFLNDIEKDNKKSMLCDLIIHELEWSLNQIQEVFDKIESFHSERLSYFETGKSN